jgi:hypothetical protein
LASYSRQSRTHAQPKSFHYWSFLELTGRVALALAMMVLTTNGKVGLAVGDLQELIQVAKGRLLNLELLWHFDSIMSRYANGWP